MRFSDDLLQELKQHNNRMRPYFEQQRREAVAYLARGGVVQVHQRYAMHRAREHGELPAHPAYRRGRRKPAGRGHVACRGIYAQDAWCSMNGAMPDQ